VVDEVLEAQQPVLENTVKKLLRGVRGLSELNSHNCGDIPQRARGCLLSYNQPMRRRFGKSRYKVTLALVAAMLLTAAAANQSDRALGQSQMPSSFPPTTGQSSGRPPLGQEPEPTPDPVLRHAQQEAAKKRNIERQSKLAANSDKIVQLAQELSNKEPASSAMAKKAEEIEKLAKSVKELMKSD
jgi:HAMP domain-containing protein